jgi:signal transduction histidine kinase
LSVILTIFAIREAEREKLLKEKEIEEEQQRVASLIINRFDAMVSDSEGRILNLLSGSQTQSWDEIFENVCSTIIESEEIVDEIFLVDEKSQVLFPLFKPLFSLDVKGRETRRKNINIQNDASLKRAERLEFQEKNYPLAIDQYKSIMAAISDKDSQVVLMSRMGRCYEKNGQHANALKIYQNVLQQCPDEACSDGIPVRIIALHQMGNIYRKIQKNVEGAGVFLQLFEGLLDARWPLSKSQFHFYRDKITASLETIILDMSDGEETKRLSRQWKELRQIEEDVLDRMSKIMSLTEDVVPYIGSNLMESFASENNFRRFSKTVAGDTYIVSQVKMADDTLFCVSLDPEVLVEKYLPSVLGQLEMQKGWHVQVSGESERVLAETEGVQQNPPPPQLGYSMQFDETLPPWKINIYQSHPNLAERQFITRRNIYILSVVVVIAAIVFGGVLAIRSTAKELELAKLKSDFVSTVSHEFRTPLTSIRYLAELLQRDRVKSKDRRKAYYKTIARESERLNRFVENVLDFSKIEAGMKEYEFEETDMTELAKDTLSRFQQQVNLKDFILESEVSEKVPKIFADREAISRALFNLLDNALKYSGKDPKVCLRVRSDGDYILMSVQDEGIGIVSEEQKKVFEKFYRSDKIHESNIKGSGIGLNIVHHIVKAHGGEVILKSEEGKGTNVTIKLPVNLDKNK